jgi:hypothetical protein
MAWPSWYLGFEVFRAVVMNSCLLGYIAVQSIDVSDEHVASIIRVKE